MLRDRGGSERGSVAITVALCMTVLLGFAALVVDVGLNWATRTSAQTAADAAALGGASRLLVDGPAAAVVEVQTLLEDNVDGLSGVAGWATDGVEANGEVVCWTLPVNPPGPGAGCPDGSNALQVITPPIQVQYAFAPVLGKATNSIKALAAAGVGPAAPNNCVLCLLDTGGINRWRRWARGRSRWPRVRVGSWSTPPTIRPWSRSTATSPPTRSGSSAGSTSDPAATSCRCPRRVGRR